jgi:CRP/FNR family cyclic AMP-dependent transcriptional regulator
MMVSQKMIATFLSNTEFFSSFRMEEIVDFIPHIDIVEAEDEAILFEEEDPGDAWYLVLHGTVGIVRGMDGAPPHELARLETGECFGEMALIDDAPRMASAVCHEDTVLATISKNTFDKLLSANDPLAMRLLRAMAGVICRRQRELTSILQDIVDFQEPANVIDHPELAEALQRHMTWN